MIFELSKTPLDRARLSADFDAPAAGALNCFEGRVRNNNDGKSVVTLVYEAYAPLCRQEMQKILKEARDRFPIIDIKVAHRIGTLKVGDLAVWVGVLAPHRLEAFAACQYTIDQLKKRLPIWKKEYYSDGTSTWPCCASEHAHERR